MSFDGIFTFAIKEDLKDTLEGGRVNRVDQPYDNEMILTIRANRQNYALLLSAHPQYARVQITDIPYENPLQPPQFCMVLRKYLNRAKLNKIEQFENDRILVFHFMNRDELGDEKTILLIAEIMGRHSNILLVDENENKILETIRHVPSALNSYRTLLPGAPFKPAPPQDKLNPMTASTTDMLQVLEASTKDSLANKIQENFQGIGRDTAKELAFRCDESVDAFPEVFDSFVEPMKKGDFTPTLIQINTKAQFTPVTYRIYDENDSEVLDSLSALLDAYYEDKSQRDRVHQMSKEIENLLKNELEKNKNKYLKQTKEIEETNEADTYRIQGEVLTAYMHQVEQGMESITLPNFYANEELIEISLKPRQTPSENAQRLFTRYQKLKKRRVYLTKEIKHTQAEIDYLDSALTQLELAEPRDVEGIREELIQEGYVKQKQKNKKKKKSQKSTPDTYYSSDGTPILVGKNNTQNDELTMRKANKTDIWLHTKDMPGSHVIIRESDPSKETLLEAAELAAYNSKARLSSSVPVDYVQVKYVNKPQGAKPGFVIYEGQSTVFVTPHKDKIKELKANVKKIQKN